jgi:quercetin dioxygenase-like cupin family protein
VRKLVTGVDPTGRSRVVAETPLVLEADPGNPGFAAAIAGGTSSAPPPARPYGTGNPVDLGVAPGFVSWVIVDYPANLDFPMHHSDTVDFDMLLEGTLVLVLDDGEHPLDPGDVVIVNGVDHGWKTGPAGCRLSVFSVGTPPPA